MKARESDIKVRRWVAMLQAADLIEREEHYTFRAIDIPESCDDNGCVLGWIGYVAGINRSWSAPGTPLGRTAQWLGYTPTADNYYWPQDSFYADMDKVCGSRLWRQSPKLTAATLRKLAEEAAT